MLCIDICLPVWFVDCCAWQLEGSPIVVAQNEKFDGKAFCLGFLARIAWIIVNFFLY